MQALELDYEQLQAPPRPVADHLRDGGIVVLRAIPQIIALREHLVAFARAVGGTSVRDELLAFYERAELPSPEALSALVAAKRAARTARLVPAMLAPLVQQLRFDGPVLLDDAVPRLVVPAPLLAELRARPELFAPEDFERARPDAAVEFFMASDSNLHRDFNRPHELFMCNLWFPMHDVGPEQVVQVYPRVYREPVVDVDNTADNRSRFGPAFAPSLAFGDAVLFHSEQLHGSAPRGADDRRHSYDMRIASACVDDNRHYRDNFWRLENFCRPDGGALDHRDVAQLATRASASASDDLLDDQRVHGDHRSAQYYDEVVRLRGLDAGSGRQLMAIFDRYPFAEDRYLQLADRLAGVSPRVARECICRVIEESESYYFCLVAARRLQRLGGTEPTRAALEKVSRLAAASPPPRSYAPIAYQNPATQLSAAGAEAIAYSLLAATG